MRRFDPRALDPSCMCLRIGLGLAGDFFLLTFQLSGLSSLGYFWPRFYEIFHFAVMPINIDWPVPLFGRVLLRLFINWFLSAAFVLSAAKKNTAGLVSGGLFWAHHSDLQYLPDKHCAALGPARHLKPQARQEESLEDWNCGPSRTYT